MTTEEKAKAYAKKELVRTIRRHAHPLDELAPYFDSKDIQQAYLAGATEVLASQWKDPKVEMPEEVTIDGWVARNKDNSLYLFKAEPWYNSPRGYWDDHLMSIGCFSIPSESFPHITFDNSPIEITLTLKPKKQ